MEKAVDGLTVASFTGGDLGQISVIIAFHFQVEDFAFWITGFGDEEFVQESLKGGGESLITESPA